MTFHPSLNRRSALGAIGCGVTSLALPAVVRAEAPATPLALHVAKSPTCGCCEAWVNLAVAEGFDVATTEMDDVTPAKVQAGVPQPLWSCHTASVAGYVIEGHVPFAAIAMLLRDRPAITGLAVPGMPIGSPGMGDDPTARFDVIAFGGDAADGQVYFKAGA
ncbi:CopG family transcriptional regulator [Salipiger sp. IMCC34102]|uniref:DUF411 domain-containing protein n=1 Tax=Salipiger sp. IMCC34102 TaxID=2510647 RepID=UPI00101BB2E7|nr:DUF411 domain-containing protein [Salipiger sp. IMCC34102]RYH00886.1 CopG family transcriptional regulator [Salipiger sp. IMCC34102]